MEKNEDNSTKKPKKHYGYRVICRVRPLLQREIAYEADKPNTDGANLTILNARAVSLTLSNEKPPIMFQFHKVLPPDTTAQDFFESIGKPAVHNLLVGVSNTILAYGQTGSGKTYSIFGPDNSNGLVPLSGHHLFALINDRPAEKYTITCSYYEIYNESLTDVLTPSGSLRIREELERGIYVEGLSEERVTSASELDALIKRGNLSRLINCTRMGTMSSRSHAVVQINLRRETDDNVVTATSATSSLIFVDLAGSERNKKTGVTEAILNEVRNINKSLASLKNCVFALNSKGRHVPYRDSKLTRILTTSLRGDHKTTFIVTCTSHYTSIEETLCTLRFGKVAHTPHLGPIVIELRTVLNPVDRGLFGLLPAELVLIIMQDLTRDLLSYKQSVWLTTQLNARRLPNKPYNELWEDLIALGKCAVPFTV
jgi:hypothetical protein